VAHDFCAPFGSWPVNGVVPPRAVEETRRIWPWCTMATTNEVGHRAFGIRAQFEPHAGDVVAVEHWCSSGFANTDLDLQLKRHGIGRVIVMGLIAHTCVEAKVCYGAELGYEVTMVKEATASYSDKEMHAALEVNIPNYACAIVTTDEIVNAISFLGGGEVAARALMVAKNTERTLFNFAREPTWKTGCFRIARNEA
jgi:Isochorismatase family